MLAAMSAWSSTTSTRMPLAGWTTGSLAGMRVSGSSRSSNDATGGRRPRAGAFHERLRIGPANLTKRHPGFASNADDVGPPGETDLAHRYPIAPPVPAGALAGRLLHRDLRPHPPRLAAVDRRRRAAFPRLLALRLRRRAGLRPAGLRLFRVAAGAAALAASQPRVRQPRRPRAGRVRVPRAAVRAAVRRGVGVDLLGRVPDP